MPIPRELSPGTALGTAAVAVLLTAAAAALALVLGGHDPGRVAAALLRGSFGDTDAVLSVTLVRSVPLILTGLAVALAFRAGVWNIGAEGQLYAGAIVAVWVGRSGTGWPGWALAPAVLLAAACAGAAWAAVPAFMKLRLGVGEVITTILMNFVGLNLAAWVVRGPLQEARGIFPQTDPMAEAARLPALIPGTRLHLGFAIALALAVALGAVLRWTRGGFELRAAGASPDAARVAGRIRVDRVVLVAFLASGALAGLAGGVEVAGVTWALYEDLSPGWGYTAIAVALLAGLAPGAVVATGVLFGALEAGAGAAQRSAGLPPAWVGVVEALAILAVLAVDLLRRRWSSGVPRRAGGRSGAEAAEAAARG